MSASKEARIELSGVIKEKIQDAKSVVFVKFSGLTVAEDTELRREFRKK
jgi:ribosomal protein L10